MIVYLYMYVYTTYSFDTVGLVPEPAIFGLMRSCVRETNTLYISVNTATSVKMIATTMRMLESFVCVSVCVCLSVCVCVSA